MAGFFNSAIDMGADALKDKLSTAFGGETKEKEPESLTDQMADMIGGGSKKDDKDQGFKGALCDAAGKCVGMVAADKAADETKGMGSTISNLASKAAGKAAADQASEKASDMLSGLFGN
ncbi:unnamed protein product [Boreogadus saida]